jgi:2'-5' RNA ligase superfamily
MSVVAIDIAILPPPDLSQRAVDLSAQLPKEESEGLLLGPDYLPHITLLQQFVDENDLPTLLDGVEAVLQRHAPIALRVTGGGMGSRSVWMEIEQTAALHDLHAQLLEIAQPFDGRVGDRQAFVDGEARDRDVKWVSGYRTVSSGVRFRPHITLGHAARPPQIEPFTFEASTVAACHLGRFCSCRRVLRAWTLGASAVAR